MSALSQARHATRPPANGERDGGTLHAFLRDYYGRRLARTADLKEGACCTDEAAGRYGSVLELIPSEVRERHYGCGCPIPLDDLTGLTVLDLGSGAGVDAFIASHLVGPRGLVHGIDFTPEQLEVARRNAPVVARRFGYAEANTRFHQGYIETAEAIPDGSVDLAISDCVVNLSPAKPQVCRTLWRVLKEGGEFYISDVLADRRLPARLREDPVLHAECLGGAEYEPDFRDLLEEAGFRDPRVVSRRVLRTELRGEPVTFSSVTMRGWKFTGASGAPAEPLDRRCEDYGQVATYRGNLDASPARFALDDHHVFEAHRPTQVCRNTARMLSETRLGRYFQVTAPVRHFGLFPCGPAPAPAAGAAAAVPGACC